MRSPVRRQGRQKSKPPATPPPSRRVLEELCHRAGGLGGLSWTIRLHKISDPSACRRRGPGGSECLLSARCVFAYTDTLVAFSADTPSSSPIVLIDRNLLFLVACCYSAVRSLQTTVRPMSRTNDPPSGHASVHLPSTNSVSSYPEDGPSSGPSTFLVPSARTRRRPRPVEMSLTL